MERVNVNEMTVKDIIFEYGVSRATAYRGKKVGHICLNYHKVEEKYTEKSVKDSSQICVEGKKYALKLLRTYPEYRLHHEDWAQDAVLKYLLKSDKDHSNPIAYIGRIALSYASDFCKKKTEEKL